MEDSKNIKYLKIIIKENFGEKWTYINQIMLYEEEAKNVDNALKYSIIYNNDDLNNSDDIEEIEIEKLRDKNNSNMEEEIIKFNDKIELPKNNNELLLVESDINKKNFEIKKINNMKSIDKKYINRNTPNGNNIKKSNKISKIEKVLKRNILDNKNKVDKEDKSLMAQNTLNNMIYKNQTNNNLSDLSEKKIFKKVFTNTPNRFFFNKTEKINNKDNDSININNKKRPFTPNIIHNNKYMNNNIINENRVNDMELLDSKDYDNILKTQLKDMEKNINLLNNINLSEVKSNNFKNINQNNNNFAKSETNNFYKKNKNDFNDEFIFNLNEEKNMTKTAYNKFYPNYNNIKHNNNTINYNENQINNNIFYKGKNNNNIKSNKKNEYNTPPSNRMSYNYFQNQDYILRDLTSNNEIDINRRLGILEINVNEIRKELNSMSHIISKITSGNYIKNIIKENIKLIFDEYMNERNLYNNINENTNDRSLYSEILNEENNQKNLENQINKKIEKKLNNISEEIKKEIFNKYLRPSLNQIEINMKKNMDEIKDKIDDIHKNNNLKDFNNFTNNKDKEKRDKFSEIISNNSNNKDIFSNSSSKLRNDKYEEINKLGEKLYRKLLEKEKKLKLLKKETSKFLED